MGSRAGGSNGGPAREWLALGAILALAAALRAPGLGRESLWLDELASLDAARQGWGELAGHMARSDVHPPLYFALLKLWSSLFGAGEAAARSLSVVLGVGAVALGHAVARRLGGARAGLAAAALLAASPFAVYYAREARPYALLLALSLAATWLLLRAAPAFRARDLVPWAACGALLLYTHVYGAFTLGAHAIYVVAAAGREPGAVRRFALAGAAAVALHAPWIPVTLAQAARVRGGFWIDAPTPVRWVRAWIFEGPAGILWVVATVFLAAAGIAWLARRSRPAAALLGGAILLPSLVPLVASFAARPMFQGKYAIFAAGALLVAAGVALAGRRARPLVACAALVAVGAFESVRDSHVARHRADWRALGAFAAAEVAAGTPVAIPAPHARYLALYLPPGVEIWALTPEELAGAGEGRFWLINVHPAETDPALAPELAARYRAAERREWFLAEALLWVDARPIPVHDQGAGGRDR